MEFRHTRSDNEYMTKSNPDTATIAYDEAKVDDITKLLDILPSVEVIAHTPGLATVKVLNPSPITSKYDRWNAADDLADVRSQFALVERFGI